MGALWPEILLAGLFLIGDIFFTGVSSAAVGVAAGSAAFAASVMAGRRKPVLLIEGLVLSAVTLLAELSAFPGGAFALAGIGLGGFLLVSGLGGRPALIKITGPLVRGMIQEDEGVVLSVFTGAALLVHGATTAVLSALGLGGRALGLLLLPPVFVTAGALSRRSLGTIRKMSQPVLVDGAGPETSALSVRGVAVGRVKVLDEGSVALVEVHELRAEDLPLLEGALARRRYRAMVITSWPHDPIHLEMNGYSRAGEHWRKVLRG